MVCVVAYFIVLYLTAFFLDCLRIRTENPRAIVVVVVVVIVAAAAIKLTPCGDPKTSKLNKLSPKKTTTTRNCKTKVFKWQNKWKRIAMFRPCHIEWLCYLLKIETDVEKVWIFISDWKIWIRFFLSRQFSKQTTIIISIFRVSDFKSCK